ncbi:MAG: NfeD family protein [Clostridiales Family XIII bacterium]|jgi:membrane protein implicated in regulation of membrane protease activity|nr:NfeD family protein [Clostridiales Family XIII bacterium]
MDIILDNMRLVWVAVFIVLLAVEALSMGLTTIWFAIGAAAACGTAWAGGAVPLQVAVFLAVSIVLVIFTRPIAVKKLKLGKEKNVTEQMQGRLGLVTETIIPFGSGQAKVDGVVWTAVGDSPEARIPEGSKVRVMRIDGVKIIVKPE